jgi:alanine dehydrogenase
MGLSRGGVVIIGVPKEVKEGECRVGLVPRGVRRLIREGSRVWVERGAGAAAGFADAEYEQAGAEVVAGEKVWEADVIVKVKEPQPAEWTYLRRGQLLLSYLHLAAAPELARELMRAGVVAIGYETVETDGGELPLLAPMSEVAGRLAVQIGASLLQTDRGGKGILLSGLAGVPCGRVVVVGCGVVGRSAAGAARSIGAEVVALDIAIEKLRMLAERMGDSMVKTIIAEEESIGEAVAEADVVIGAVLVPGARAPRVITRRMVEAMQAGSVIIDVSIDQGGCSETSRPTSLLQPTYEFAGVIHYCVPNIPSLVARTSSCALTAAIMPYVSRIASSGWRAATQEDRSLARGVNVCRGAITHRRVAEELGLPYVDLEEARESDEN